MRTIYPRVTTIGAVQRHFTRYRLEIISFVTGFSLLAYELAAARVLAPSIGSSTYVWTGVIGVIIAALSLGFFLGGRLADRRNHQQDIVWLLLLAALMVWFTLSAYEGVLQAAVASFSDRRWQAVFSALVLFAPASFLIGATSPYLAKLKIASLSATGRSVASLDAFNAMGGIIGTFVTGFILFGYIGSRETFVLVATLLVLVSWLLVPRIRRVERVIISIILVLMLTAPVSSRTNVVSIDTASANYEVIEGVYDGRMVTGLLTGPSGTQSAVYQDGTGEMVFWYTGEMARLALERQPASILVLGGGAFTLPQYLSQHLPESRIDVVEIDPELAEISTEHFGFRHPDNVRLVFDDARAYVNEANKRYDMILVDVYGDADIPFTLMTEEYGEAIAKLVEPQGIVAVNLIAGSTGSCREVFSAVHGAYAGEFTYGQYRPDPRGDARRSNNILLYSNQPVREAGYLPIPVRDTHIYSDNFAPGERLYYACQRAA